MQKKVSDFWKEPIAGYDPWRDSKGYVFYEDVAERVCAFFPKYLKHAKGKFASMPFELLDWEKKLVGHLFGWRDKNKLRRYRECFLYVPKKNGKTQIAAGLGLVMLVADNEKGAEVYSASGDKDQAGIIFEAASFMVEADKTLSENIEILRGYKFLKFPATESYWKVLSSEAKTKHGPNIHGLFLDELHAFPDNDLIDTLTRGTVAREQPITCYMTTADYAGESQCNTLLQYARNVRDNNLAKPDPTFFPIIYESFDDKDDWDKEETWKKVNPSYGVTVKKDYFEREVQKAKAEPSKQSSFKRLHLNMQTDAKMSWISIKKWDKCIFDESIDNYAGADCTAAFDLSSNDDITALDIRFIGCKKHFTFFWLPEKTIQKRIEYKLWHKQGLIESTPGETVDYDFIFQRILEINEKFNLLAIAYDDWNAKYLIKLITDSKQIKAEKYNFRQGYKTLSPASKEFERRIVKGEELFCKNQVMRWMASNVKVQEDPAGNIKPVKENKSSKKKIDGIVAAIMNVGLDMNDIIKETKSIYEKRGLIII